MKKIVLGIAIASLVIGCKKVSAGGNLGRLKLEEGTERYSDAHQGNNHENASAEGNHTTKTAVKVNLNGTDLQAFQGGLEEQMITFLKSGGYKNATDDAVLKDKWYSFDQVNFKMGSANELETGSEGQIQNLAKILKAFPDAKIKIGGYTDKTGDEAKNLALSKERANFIKSELTKAGVGAQILEAEGYGSKFAMVDAKASDAERAIDRKMAVRFAK